MKDIFVTANQYTDIVMDKTDQSFATWRTIDVECAIYKKKEYLGKVMV